MSAKPLDTEAVLQAYREGGSLRDVAAEFGCSHVHVQRILQRSGEPLRPPCRTNAPLPLTAEERQELRREAVLILHRSGMSPERIAAAFGFKRKWAVLLLREGGIAV